MTEILASLTAAAALLANPTPFATRVLEYDPAPGQFVNDPQFNNPLRALGAPVGGGTASGDLSKVVTLGGFGGSLTLGFDETIHDDPRNPSGLDAIVYGNAWWTGNDPARRWGEAGVVEISLDTNRNGEPDDAWYLIPGSHLTDPNAQRRNGIFILPDDPFGRPPIVNRDPASGEFVFGYADLSPTLILGDLDGDNIVDDPLMSPSIFYTTPDDPRVVGISLSAGGGDAFDIAWAIDPTTGEPANLNGFDFIRITTAVDAENFPFGEISVEISAVAAVRPTPTSAPAPTLRTPNEIRRR
ncbi:MAG: hypothetical protein ACF8PN_15905 [Phycisphaerales bacterium]